MKREMNRKVILVTGASSGIGKAIAQALIEEGHVVFGAARRLEAMRELQEKGGFTRPVDVTRDEQLTGLVGEIVDRHGRIDVLINNAGYSIYGALEETPPAEARALLEVNLLAYARLAQLVLPHMRERGEGTIINVGSVAGFISIPTNGWYCASKFALEGLTDSLRMEVRHLGIRVVLIEPEVIHTNFGERALDSLQGGRPIEAYAHFRENWKAIVPDAFRKGGAPEKVAHIVRKILRKKRPKSRYFVPARGRVLVLAKKMLPASWVDFLTLFILRRLAP